MAACADPKRPHGWIDQEFIAADGRLHRMGIADSVECFFGGELVGTYGVGIGGFFAGESMFHRRTGASKARGPAPRRYDAGRRCGIDLTCSGARPDEALE